MKQRVHECKNDITASANRRFYFNIASYIAPKISIHE